MGNYSSDRKNTRFVGLKLNRNTDSDIIRHLETIDNMQGYLKDLIRADMKEDGKMTIRELAKNWIDNADTTPGMIDLKTAAQYIDWMDKDEDLPEDLTPESFMEAWNDTIRG